MSVGRLALHGGAEVRQGGGGVQAGRVGLRLPDLQVGLSVQVAGLYEGYALGLAAIPLFF